MLQVTRIACHYFSSLSHRVNMSKLLRRGLASFARKTNVWTSEKVILSPYHDVEVPMTTVHEYVFSKLDKWPTKTAVVCGVTKRKYTYEEVYRLSKIFGANLRSKFKIKDGDTVAIILPNSPEFPIAVYGTMTAGGIVTTMNPVYTPYELQRQIDSSGAKLIVTHPDIVPNVKKALELAKKDIQIIAMNFEKPAPVGTISFKDLIDEVHIDLTVLNEVKRSHEDVALLMYSSGTTGLPKPAELSHFNVVANCCQQDTELRQYSYTTESHQDTTLVVLPMFHAYAFSLQMLHKMSAGLQLVTLPKFQPESFLNTLLNYKIDLMYLAPPMILYLGSYSEVKPKHLEHVKLMLSGAAPLPSADIQKMFDKAQRNFPFRQGYGMTEGGPLVTIMPTDIENYESVGYLLPNMKARVIDSHFNNLGPDEVGELLIKGPNVMKQYKDNPEANKESFVDGWYKTGDLAKVNDEGLVWIVDRLKELIKVKGFQVPPAELEAVIKEHPDVFDVAVMGIPDRVTGEAPKAFVILKQGATVTDEQLISFVSNKVASYKKIKQVQFVDSIPKNPSGKILRKVLKEMYLN
ncbi:4-coumarate--CoA ligase 2 [Manduca sexta]|uniref:Uncharacterized protein n=1 Tax=Manduca sexta TaxID=7130 RepID=A0A921ZLF7_MANSE|nr:4-coumarate--CoA ligase 2 [Manduca sexta]KAG6459990.1 hypothetical protein O3G_MSEX011712 [Manduca sexta]